MQQQDIDIWVKQMRQKWTLTVDLQPRLTNGAVLGTRFCSIRSPGKPGRWSGLSRKREWWSGNWLSYLQDKTVNLSDLPWSQLVTFINFVCLVDNTFSLKSYPSTGEKIHHEHLSQLSSAFALSRFVICDPFPHTYISCFLLLVGFLALGKKGEKIVYIYIYIQSGKNEQRYCSTPINLGMADEWPQVGGRLQKVVCC